MSAMLFMRESCGPQRNMTLARERFQRSMAEIESVGKPDRRPATFMQDAAQGSSLNSAYTPGTVSYVAYRTHRTGTKSMNI